MVRLNETRIAAFLSEPVGGSFQRALAMSQHREHATTLLVGVDGEVTVGRVRARAIVVPPDVTYAATSDGPAVSFVFDPELRPGLAAYARDVGIHAIELGDLIRARRGELDDPHVLAGLAEDAARRLARGRPRPIDRRIARLLDELRAPDGDRVAARARTGLSSAHLQALFVRDVGIPLRTYALWRRLLHGLARIGPLDVTASAHAAGFADLAHFSRTCRRMLGVSPSMLKANLGDRSRP